MDPNATNRIIHRNSLYEISKFIANILKPYGKLKEQHTCSHKSFSTFICQQKIEPDEIMVSFNVTSLYTTTPIDKALLIIKDLLEHDNKLADRTLLSPRQILDLLDILLRTTYFKFNEDRAAIVSEIYMQSLEKLPSQQQTTQSLGTPCRRCLLDSTQNLHSRTTRTHQQFTSPNTIHQRRRNITPLFHSSTP